MSACAECERLWQALENLVFSIERARTKLMGMGSDAESIATIQADIDALEAEKETACSAIREHEANRHGSVARNGRR